MNSEQIVDDIRRGWTAPVLLVVISTLMATPITGLAIVLMGGLFRLDIGMATAFAGILHIIVTFWIAGYRLRRSGR